MTFWLIAMGIAVLVTVIVIRPMLRKPQVDADEAGQFDMQVYRDQLTEVERDLERGVLAPDEAERTRIEVSRRILDADKAAQAAGKAKQAKQGMTLAIGALSAVLVLAGTVGTYLAIGAPGVRDLPLEQRREGIAANQANRPSQAEVEAQVGDITELADQAEDAYKTLVAQLRETAESRPDDLRGQLLLAQHEARLGNFAAARIAMGKALALKGDDVVAGDLTDHAELMIIAANGYVSPEAEKSLAAALRLDPKDPRARYYSGLDLAQNGRPDLAYRLWVGLLQEGPEDAPWIRPIREQIGDVARMAGIRPAPLAGPAPGPQSPPLAGPTAEQVEDAQDMAPEDQQQMIRDMVGRLSDRLAGEGGTAPEWARLIRAYGVLGETDRAATIYTEAKGVFANNPEAMAELSAAASAAGIPD